MSADGYRQRVNCDAVVIGAGHNGLTVATHLQRAGYSTVVVEKAPVPGGQCASVGPLLPGFRFQPHASWLNYLPLTAHGVGLPMVGVDVVVPEVQHGIAFSDGRPGIVLHRIEQIERTRASIARHSPADADTFVQLVSRARRLTPSLSRVLFAAPTATSIGAHLAAVEAAYAGLGVASGLGRRTARALIDELFTSDEMQALMYLLAAEFGVALGEPGGDVALLGVTMWMIGGRGLPVGGMQSVAGALTRAATDAGVVIQCGAEVRAIILAGGAAGGVELVDGRTIRAPLVVSGAPRTATLLRLVDSQVLSTAAREEVRQYQRRPGTTTTAQLVCLREPPRYTSARFEPDLDLAAQTFIGYDSTTEVADNLAAVECGQLPRPAGSVSVPSRHDPSLAPAGGHTATVNTTFPSVATISGTDQQQIRASYVDALMERWRAFAPNMTDDNVLGHHFAPFLDSDRSVLLRPDGHQCATPVPGLYLCGASTYPGGGVHGACGWNAYAAIMADLATGVGSG